MTTNRARWTEWAGPLAVVVVVAVVYRAAFSAELLNWDDDRFLWKNPRFAGLGGAYAWDALTAIRFEVYQPLHLLSYLPDLWLWPTNPVGFHVANLVLFAACVVALYRLARRRASALAATLACLVFAVHPLVVEPVMWVTARKDLLALLLVVIALGLEDRDYRPRAVPVIVFACALLAKCTAVSFPPILIAWLCFMRRLPFRAAAARSAPYWLPAIAAGVVAIAIWAQTGRVAASQLRVLDIPAAFGFNLFHALVPIDLAPLYPEHPPPLAALVVVAAAVALVAFRRRVPRAAWFVIVAAIAVILPLSNVVPVFRLADRYMLVALALAVPAGALLVDALAPRRWVVAIAVAISIAAAHAAWRQADAWRDSLALWTHTVRAQPDSLFAHLKLGETLRDAGRFDDAIAEYREAIRIEPDRDLGYAGLFFTYATRAEAAGALASGTAARWLAQLGGALADRASFVAMFGEVERSSCAPCKDTLLLLALKTWVPTDAALLDYAADALARGVPDEALVFLSVVRVPGARHAELTRRARLALPR